MEYSLPLGIIVSSSGSLVFVTGVMSVNGRCMGGDSSRIDFMRKKNG
jgi:hypothetical protein